jgi:hypothetical protein
VARETCGGDRFVEIGMLPNWLDDNSTERLEQTVREVEYQFNKQEDEALFQLIQEELRLGIVHKVRRNQLTLLSPIFPVPKSNGKWRKVTDNRIVNSEQCSITCRMDGAHTVQQLAIKGDWATSADIKNAFNHVRVNESLAPFLGFRYRGEYYAYRAMPFGCKHSPRVFIQTLGYALRYIRVHWQVRIIAYMDDLLLLHQDKVYLKLATIQIAFYLVSLGWTLSLDKCEFTPQREIKYLGWRWDFDTLSLRMTQEMRKSLLFRVRQTMNQVVRGERMSCRRLSSVIGCLNSLRLQIPKALFYLLIFHSALTVGVNSTGWNGSVMPDRAIASELHFWWRNISYNTL